MFEVFFSCFFVNLRHSPSPSHGIAAFFQQPRRMIERSRVLFVSGKHPGHFADSIGTLDLPDFRYRPSVVLIFVDL